MKKDKYIDLLEKYGNALVLHDSQRFFDYSSEFSPANPSDKMDWYRGPLFHSAANLNVLYFLRSLEQPLGFSRGAFRDLEIPWGCAGVLERECLVRMPDFLWLQKLDVSCSEGL